MRSTTPTCTAPTSTHSCCTRRRCCDRSSTATSSGPISRQKSGRACRVSSRWTSMVAYDSGRAPPTPLRSMRCSNVTGPVPNSRPKSTWHTKTLSVMARSPAAQGACTATRGSARSIGTWCRSCSWRCRSGTGMLEMPVPNPMSWPGWPRPTAGSAAGSGSPNRLRNSAPFRSTATPTARPTPERSSRG